MCRADRTRERARPAPDGRRERLGEAAEVPAGACPLLPDAGLRGPLGAAGHAGRASLAPLHMGGGRLRRGGGPVDRCCGVVRAALAFQPNGTAADAHLPADGRAGDDPDRGGGAARVGHPSQRAHRPGGRHEGGSRLGPGPDPAAHAADRLHAGIRHRPSRAARFMARRGGPGRRRRALLQLVARARRRTDAALPGHPFHACRAPGGAGAGRLGLAKCMGRAHDRARLERDRADAPSRRRFRAARWSAGLDLRRRRSCRA